MVYRLRAFKKWMIDAGITQAAVARKAGVSPVSIHQFCKGFMVSSNIETVFRQLGCPETLLEKKAA